KRRRVSGKTKKQAGDNLRAALAKLGNGGPTGTATVESFCDWWLAAADARVGTGPDDISSNTAINYRWALTPVIRELGKRRLADIDSFAVEWLLSTLAATGMARNSVSRVRSVFAKALDDALARGMVDRNAARLANMPRTAPTPERRALTAHQAQTLLSAVAGDPLEAFVVTGLYLGLRPGELLGLTWDAIDFDADTLEVRAAMKREPKHGGRPERQRLGEVKTRRSRRTLDLPAPVATALRAHRRRQLEDQLAAGPVWSNPNNLVFTNNAGRPMAPSNMNKKLKELTERAGLGRWSMTELARHSAASLLSDAGLSNEQIADVLGHESTRMLERHYRHPIRPTVAAHVAPMQSILNNL
ncbi:MAG: site-specific integrase, partial [Actinobacteria bacterium]|nr:site-specific integrase [Actinomycetota bacterium]